jgi:hypothetical protein
MGRLDSEVDPGQGSLPAESSRIQPLFKSSISWCRLYGVIKREALQKRGSETKNKRTKKKLIAT